MRRIRGSVFSALAFGGVIVACGSRTGLLADDFTTLPIDASLDSFSSDVSMPDDSSIDATSEEPPILFDGGLLDVQVDCDTPQTCNPEDPGYIYKCGVRVEQCSSLEQCAMVGSDPGVAECVNPCRDTLGQNTSNGCEFYAVEMDTTDEVKGVCFAVYVVNQWQTGEPARLQVDRGGETLPIEQFARIPVGTGTNIEYAPYSQQTGLAKGQIAILFLSRDPDAVNDGDPSAPRALANCPAGVTPAIVGDAAIHGTGRGTSFHLKTNVPVVSYQMLPYGAGRARVTGATLLFPTNVWDTNYVVANAYSAPTTISEDRAGPTMTILAQDATNVTIVSPTAIQPGGGLDGTPANIPITYALNRGEYLQFTQSEELTGSIIQSDKPIAVIGGATLMDVPTDLIRADSAEQMLPPIRALGSEYVAVRYRNRGATEESVPWRVVGAVNGTVLTYEPAAPPGAPTTLDSRQMVEFEAPGPFVVKSQDAAHPFYMAAYMTGGQAFDGAGDPEFVNVVTPAQYLPRYTFFTDPTYPETNLVVTRMRDAETGQMPDVTLDCAGTLTGWQSAGTSGKYEFTRLDLSTGNFEGQNGCDNGVHTIEGTFAMTPGLPPAFGVTVWGWGNPITWPPDITSADEANPKFTRWVSYAYPAGSDVKRLNEVVVPAQ